MGLRNSCTKYGHLKAKKNCSGPTSVMGTASERVINDITLKLYLSKNFNMSIIQQDFSCKMQQ